uniref:C2H2-type domain-containing protein n=1 Tax=Periophthalmus magnuspinnatus TaxID=409849 RepID=A0A3B3ZD93_9GOBI
METEADGDHCNQVQKGQTLRALVNERLTAAAEEIFALFERTIAEYEEELCRSKEENQRNQDTPQTPRIKEEPEEQSIKQEEDTLPAQVTPINCSAAQMETEADGDHCNQSDKKYECPMCQKRFETMQKLQRHIRIHSGERPYSCLTCKKTFTKKSHLDRHLKVHTGERPYSCLTCKKTFTQKSNQHVNIHTGEKPYSCPTCEKTFTHKSFLGAHLRIHTGGGTGHVSMQSMEKKDDKRSSLRLQKQI